MYSEYPMINSGYMCIVGVRILQSYSVYIYICSDYTYVYMYIYVGVYVHTYLLSIAL